MPKADKKQRHKAKREAKRLAARRQASVSPLKRLADAPGSVDCWMSDDFDSMGQAQIFVYKRAAGLSGLACFLIDRGVVGLKDAWSRIHIDRMEVDDMLATCKEQGLSMKRTSLEKAREFIAGGIRWAHDNGMRLPKDWAKTVMLLGGVGDWAAADVSAFVMEFAGHPEDLRQRLIGQPFETYIQRTDIDFIFGDAPYLDQETGDYIDEESDDLDDFDEEEIDAFIDRVPKEALDAMAAQLNSVAVGLVGDTTAWLNARNQAPSPELLEAWRAILMSYTLARLSMPDKPDDAAEMGKELLEGMSKLVETPRLPEYQRAVAQAIEHLEIDPAMMQNAVLKFSSEDE